MSTDTVDMSVLISGEPRKVRFDKDGRDYLFPVDIPIETAERIQALTDRAQQAMQTATAGDPPEDTTLIAELRALILELAQQEDPTVETLPIRMAQLFLFFQATYGGLDLTKFAAVGKPGPTKARKARAAGTKKTSSTSRQRTAAKTRGRRSSTS